MAKMLLLEKKVSNTPSDDKITNIMYKVRFENNDFVVYDWDLNKTSHKFNFESFKKVYNDFIESEYQYDNTDSISDKQLISKCMNVVKSGNIWYISNNGKDVLAFETLSKEKGYTVINELCVGKESRGKGYGKHLLKFAEILANDVDTDRMKLKVMDDNTVAKELYFSYGFDVKKRLDGEGGSNSMINAELINEEDSKESLDDISMESVQVDTKRKYTYNNKKERTGRRRFKCLDCDQRFGEFEQLVKHASKFHKDLIGEEDVYRYLYEKRNPGPYICAICNKNPRPWDPVKKKYKRICEDPVCIKKSREAFQKNMKKVYGTDNLLNDPEHQAEMVANRSISGKFKFKDGTQITYVGKYELDFLQYCVTKYGFDSTDVIECPSNFYIKYRDVYTEKDRWYIPDFYLPKYNLVIEIKDGSKFPPDSKAKSLLKEEAVIKANKFNYLKIVDKNYTDFDSFMNMFAENHYSEEKRDREYVFIIPENKFAV